MEFLSEYAQNTMNWGVKSLHQLSFLREPTEIVTWVPKICPLQLTQSICHLPWQLSLYLRFHVSAWEAASGIISGGFANDAFNERACICAKVASKAGTRSLGFWAELVSHRGGSRQFWASIALDFAACQDSQLLNRSSSVCKSLSFHFRTCTWRMRTRQSS